MLQRLMARHPEVTEELTTALSLVNHHTSSLKLRTERACCGTTRAAVSSSSTPTTGSAGPNDIELDMYSVAASVDDYDGAHYLPRPASSVSSAS
jgi:hypothetical protein